MIDPDFHDYLTQGTMEHDPNSVESEQRMARVKVIDFKRGVKYAKQMGGVYDPASKTWEVPDNAPELGNLKAYGLALAESPDIPSIDVIDSYGLQKAMDDKDSIL